MTFQMLATTVSTKSLQKLKVFRLEVGEIRKLFKVLDMRSDMFKVYF